MTKSKAHRLVHINRLVNDDHKNRDKRHPDTGHSSYTTLPVAIATRQFSAGGPPIRSRNSAPFLAQLLNNYQKKSALKDRAERRAKHVRLAYSEASCLHNSAIGKTSNQSVFI